MVIAARRSGLRASASDQMLEWKIPKAPPATAPVVVLDRLGSSRHGWLLRTMPASSRNLPRSPRSLMLASMSSSRADVCLVGATMSESMWGSRRSTAASPSPLPVEGR